MMGARDEAAKKDIKEGYTDARKSLKAKRR